MEQVPEGYEYFAAKLQEVSGIDLAAYKSRQMTRRLSGYLKRSGFKDFYVLARRIERDPDALDALKDFITINVSEFFRNPERFEYLERTVIPELCRRFGNLSVWSAGCSIGAEPYSLAIILRERGDGARHRILATDIDRSALQIASRGEYHADKLKEVSPERLAKWFIKLDDAHYQVKPEIRRMVAFREHDLIREEYPERMHLVLCRNVVIYFTEEAKERVFTRFAGALVPGGYLMLGTTESVLRAHSFGFEAAGPFLYRRREGS